ncbi:ABC transporter permease [Candidatus Sumerlaeota bacterium]|nr:ABC transporter permease [Candidatus Sumerlaeota bacterium]
MSETPSETVISSRASVRFMQTLRDVVQYRELFYAFVKRDLMVRYKQTAFGVAWVVMQPLLTGVIFAVLFGMISGRFSGMKDVVFFLAALVPWAPFQNGVQMAANSMEMNANLISKVYFPRLVIPGAYICGSVIDFLITFCVLLIAAAAAGQFTLWLLVMMPPLLVIQCAAGWGLGLFFAALNAQYRDIKYAVPFILQTGMLLTVLIPVSRWKDIHPALHFLMTLNPMAGVVETYRAALTDAPMDFSLLARAIIVSFLLLVFGIRFFAAREQKLIDIL